MAYQLQANLPILENPAVPPECATENVVAPPQPSSLNYCCRPNTMLYGTAPYMAGKGAPANLIMTDDELRPQATTRHDKTFVNNTRGAYFPIQNMNCSLPLRTMSYEPTSTRAEVQNGLFAKRYCNK